MLEIKLESNGMLFRVGCWLCGMSFRMDVIVAKLYIDGDENGVLCERCLDKGPDAIRTALLDRAANLKEGTKTVVDDMLHEAAECEKQAREINIPEDIALEFEVISAAIEQEMEANEYGEPPVIAERCIQEFREQEKNIREAFENKRQRK